MTSAKQYLIYEGIDQYFDLELNSDFNEGVFDAVSGQGFFVNSGSGAITVTLPSSPSAGDIVSIADYGFNAATSEYGDMISMGILDPAKVTRTALQAAGSVAGLMITTEAMVSEIPEESPAGGMPGGMPPGMGGMDGMM